MSGPLATTLAVALSVGVLYAVLAVGFTASYQLLGEANLAFGDTVGLAVLLSAVVYSTTHSIALALVVALGAALVASLLVDRLVVGPLRGGDDRLAPIIATVGAALVLRNLALAPFGADDRAFPPVLGSGSVVVGTTAVDATALGAALLLAVTGALTAVLFRRRWGRALVAVRDDPLGAALTGIPVRRLAAFVYAAAGLVGAFGGVLVAAHVRSAGAEMGWRTTLLAFTAAIVGGGSLRGAAAGGMILGALNAVAQVVIGSSWADAYALVALVVLILARPNGIRRRAITSRP
ncbi:MAG: branched-chain amino acid ABC transporter permease [Candidatus Dormibacteria bacterium]